MPINPRNVAALIQAALAYGYVAAVAEQRPNLYTQLDLATQRLYDDRNSGRPGTAGNLDLAAAEHYLNARFFVASGRFNRLQVEEMVKTYALLKLIVPEPLVRHNARVPATKFDLGVVSFGLLGAAHGDIDRQFLHLPVQGFWIPQELYGFSQTVRNIVETVGLNGLVRAITH